MRQKERRRIIREKQKEIRSRKTMKKNEKNQKVYLEIRKKEMTKKLRKYE